MCFCGERCRPITTAVMSKGTARNAPKGPHIHAQKAIDKKTRKGYAMPDDRGRNELPLQGRDPDPGQGRDERVTEGRKAHQPDYE